MLSRQRLLADDLKNSRGSVIVPVMAVAAAVAGLAR